MWEHDYVSREISWNFIAVVYVKDGSVLANGFDSGTGKWIVF